MIDLITWILPIISIIGYYLAIKKHSACFVIFVFADFVWMLYFIYKTAYPGAFLMLVYVVFGIYGFYKWSKKC